MANLYYGDMIYPEYKKFTDFGFYPESCQLKNWDAKIQLNFVSTFQANCLGKKSCDLVF